MAKYFKFSVFISLFLTFSTFAGTPRGTKHIMTLKHTEERVSYDKETGKKKLENLETTSFTPAGDLISVEFNSNDNTELIISTSNQEKKRLEFPSFAAAKEVKDLLESDQELTIAYDKRYEYTNRANLMVKLPDSDEYVNLETNPENVLGHEGLAKIADCLFPVNINKDASGDFADSIDDHNGAYGLSILEGGSGVIIRALSKQRIKSETLNLERLLAASGEKDAAAIAEARSCLRKAKRFKLLGNLMIVDGIATPIVRYFDRQVSPTALTRAAWVGGNYAWDKGSEAVSSLLRDSQGDSVNTPASQPATPDSTTHN